jgi:F-type H+-transporting ATPase subunit b
MLNFSVTFFITLVNLAILFLIMRVILFKPVRKFMASRQAAVKNDIEIAAQQRNEAEKFKSQYEAQLAKAREEGDAIIKDARAAADKNAELIIGQANDEAKAIEERAQQEMEQEKRAMRSQFQAQAVALVLAVCAKLLKRELNDEDSRNEAARFLEQLELKRSGLGGDRG